MHYLYGICITHTEVDKLDFYTKSHITANTTDNVQNDVKKVYKTHTLT